MTLALVEHEAAEARRQADLARERMQAVFEASRDALLIADQESGLILDANLRAERLSVARARSWLASISACCIRLPSKGALSVTFGVTWKERRHSRC